MRKLIVSPSPHIHGDQSTRRIMTDVLIALAPAVLVSICFFGFSAVRLLLTGAVSCIALEYLIQKFILRTEVTVSDCSAAVTGVLLALNLPPSAPWWVVLIGSIVAIGIAKMTFGGLGQNIFNPALTGRVFLLVSFPVIMTDWTVPAGLFGAGADAFSGATPLSIMKEGLASGMTTGQIFAANPDLSYLQMLFFRIGGSAGEASALALILGFVWLLVRKVIKPTIPLVCVGTVFVVSGIFWLCDPSGYTDPVFNVLSGGILLGAIFMATDYVTSPMSTGAQVVYAFGIGLLTVLIRFFGSYPEGVSFAILIMNAVVPLLNKYMRPARFGSK